MYFDNEIITSRNNQLVKWAAALSDKKNRKDSGYFMAEGVKLTREAFEAGLPVDYCIVSEAKTSAAHELLAPFKNDKKYEKCRVVTVSENVFEKISTEKAPQGVISVIKHLDFFRDLDIIYKEEFFLEPEEKAIFLFSVRDPSNLGAVIRSSVAFGTDHIILSGDCADIYNPKTIQATMGAIGRVRVHYVDLPEMLASLKGKAPIYGTFLDGEVVYTKRLEKHGVIVMGNEGNGIGDECSRHITERLLIPSYPEGRATSESLNVSVATAIICNEFRRNG